MRLGGQLLDSFSFIISFQNDDSCSGNFQSNSRSFPIVAEGYVCVCRGYGACEGGIL